VRPDPRDASFVTAHASALVAGGCIAAALAAVTISRLGMNANALAWSAVQCLLVGLAFFDLATRRIPNAVTVPAALAAIVVRILFVRSALPEILIAGFASLLFFLVFALRTSGLGMGDVKLAGLLGLLLGESVLYGLLIGTIVGGVVSLALVARSRAWLRRSIAYGPYLCLGGAVAILAFSPPALI
jgi:leader peptidase (prepilin peptidase) / N-methyltransferase